MNADDMFAELFAGRPDAVGTEQGGAKRMSVDDMDHMSPDMWWRQQLNAHLEIGGEYAIGAYPVDNNMVRWGCIDWDEGEGDIVHAVNTRAVLEHMGITSWIERSRSKGFHLWVFMDDWMPMANMRKALLVAAELAEAPTKEINPKQMTLEPDALGNYVRLPYPGRVPAPGGRRRILSNGDLDQPELGYETATAAMHASRNAPSSLDPLVDMWVEPPPVFAPKFIPDSAGEIHSRMSGFAATVFRQGPREGEDRSQTLWKLAKLLAEHRKHTEAEAIQLVTEADASWGHKFVGRSDGPTQIQKLVRKAFT